MIATSTLGARQSEQPIFRSQIAIVEVTVIVRDRDGGFVSNLTIEDFEVFEGDAPQRVQSLYLVGHPSAATGPGESTDTARPAQRTFVFAFDAEHVSPGGLTRARDALMQFTADRLRPGDLAGAIAVGGSGDGRVSTDRDALVQTLKSLKPRGDALSRAAELRQWPRIANEAEAVQIGNNDEQVRRRAVERACSEQPEACGGPNPAAALAQIEAEILQKAILFVRDSRASGQRSIAALDQMARGLSGLPGRKTVVWISEGTFSDELREQARGASYRAAQSGVAVYALDPRGLSRRTGGRLDSAAPEEVGMDVLLAAAEDPAELLAFGSGGLSIRDQNRLDLALRTIEDDTSTYYVLGYAASEGRQESQFRPLRVRVRRPGVTVRARHGYMAPARVTTLRAAVPATVEPKTSEGDTSEPAPVETEKPLIAATPEPAVAAVSATGTIVGSAAATPVAAVRLRPDAAERIREIAGGDLATSDELAHRGWDAYQRGDVETAVGLFAEAATKPAVRPWVLYTLGLSHAALGHPSEAATSWEHVRQAAPAFKSVYLDLADTYMQIADLTRALAVLRDAEKRWQGDPEIQNAIGVIHVRRGAINDAITAFSKAAETAPDDALTYWNMGRAFELRYIRGRRYVSSQRMWTANDEDRRKAMLNYRRCVDLGGPYAKEAEEALGRLDWLK
jgi:VWFA-related protein